MTPHQAAKAHCANYQSDGSCLGAYFDDKGNHTHVVSLKRCLLAQPCGRCPYFEECVAPMKLSNERDRAEFAEAVHDYQMAVTGGTFIRRCRLCDQRDTGDKQRQLCVECREKRRKETYRASKRKSRHAECPHSVVVSSSASAPENRTFDMSATTILAQAAGVDIRAAIS